MKRACDKIRVGWQWNFWLLTLLVLLGGVSFALALSCRGALSNRAGVLWVFCTSNVLGFAFRLGSQVHGGKHWRQNWVEAIGWVLVWMVFSMAALVAVGCILMVTAMLLARPH